MKSRNYNNVIPVKSARELKLFVVSKVDIAGTHGPLLLRDEVLVELSLDDIGFIDPILVADEVYEVLFAPIFVAEVYEVFRVIGCLFELSPLVLPRKPVEFLTTGT